MRHHRGALHHGGGPEPGYPLTMASAGEYIRVVTITADPASESRLVSMGINPGAMLRVVSSSGGPIVVARDETRYGIDRKIAWHILVVPVSPDTRGFRRDPCRGSCRGCSYRQGSLETDLTGTVSLDSLPEGATGTVACIRGIGWRRKKIETSGIGTGSRVSVLGRGKDPEKLLVDVDGTSREIPEWDAIHVMVRVES